MQEFALGSRLASVSVERSRGGVSRIAYGLLAGLGALLFAAWLSVAAAFAGDWSVSVNDSPDPVGLNSYIIYTITVTNVGGEPLAVGDALVLSPTDLTFEGLQVPQGWNCVLSPNSGSCSAGEALAGASYQFTLVANSGAATSPSRTLGVGLSITDDGNNSDNQATAVTTIGTTTTTKVYVGSAVLVNEPAPIAVTVTSEPAGQGTPTGFVKLLDNGVEIDRKELSSGEARFNIPFAANGRHPLTADYEGDTSFLTSSSPAADQSVDAQVQASLTSDVNPSFFGQTVQLTGTFTAIAPGTGSPPNEATFQDGGAFLGQKVLNSGGVGTFATSSLSVGSHSITVLHPGAPSFRGASSPAISQVVLPASTTTAIVGPGASTPYGSAIDLSATVSVVAPGGGTPAGTVEFRDAGGSVIASAALDGSGTATAQVPTLEVGTYDITAVYLGSTDHTTSTSPSLSHTVIKAPTSTTLTTSSSSTVYGQAYTMTVNVSAAVGGGGIPTGRLDFLDNGGALRNMSLDASGNTVLTIYDVGAGTHSIAVQYAGNEKYQGSVSATVDLTVAKADPTITVGSSPSPGVYGEATTVTATVTSPGLFPPMGSVNLGNGSAPGPLDEEGSITDVVSALPPGNNVFTATYGGDANHNAAIATYSVQIEKAGTVTSVSTSLSPSRFGEAATFTAAVGAAAPNGFAPDGPVEFFDGSTPLGIASLAGGQATFSVSSLAAGAHSIQAVYQGSSTFEPSTSTTIEQTVDKGPVTVALASSSSTSVSGESVVFTATVLQQLTGAAAPSGVVTFYDDGSLEIGAGSVSGGVATLATATLPVGIRAITAVFQGTDNLDTATSTSLSHRVNPASTSTALTSSSNPGVSGEAVAFTATVSPVAPGSGTPEGTVTFFDGASPLGAAILSGGEAAHSFSFAAGSHSITAVYNGAANHLNSTSPSLTQDVNKANTATTLDSSPNPNTYGEAVNLAVTVAAGAPGSGTPTGAVIVSGGNLGAPITVALINGQAFFAVSSLNAGMTPLQAEYTGNQDFNSSTGFREHIVSQATPTVTLASLPNPSLLGDNVTFSVEVIAPGSGIPTGSVLLQIGGSSQTVTLDGAGKASFSVDTLTADSHAVSASYAGDANFAAAGSPTITQLVQAPTTTVFTTSPNPSFTGQSVDLTAQVSVPPGAPAPTGAVSFFADGVNLATGAVTGGFAVLHVSTLPPGTHDLHAEYSGDVYNLASTSATVSQAVNKSDTIINLTSSGSPSIYGAPATFTATVNPASIGAGGTPTGNVIFKDGSAATLGSVTLDASGQAALTTSDLMTGSHSIIAEYGGDAGYNGTTGLPLGHMVAQAFTTTTINSSATSTLFGEEVIFTATVSTNAPSTANPDGAVEFFSVGGTSLGTAPLSGGTGSFAISTLAVGSHSVYAAYVPASSNLISSTSTRIGLSVGKAGTTTALTASPATAMTGQDVTFTATVARATSGAGVPTGDVEFYNGGAFVQRVSLDNSGNASMVLSFPFHGIVASVRAIYVETPEFASSLSGTLFYTVEQADTEISVASSSDTSTLGDAVTFTATVSVVAPGSGSVATETVEFFDGTTSLGRAQLSSSGVAILSTTDLAPGSRPITASYLAGGTFKPSTSLAIIQTVNQALPTISLITDPVASVMGQQVTVVAELNGPAGLPVATGSVDLAISGVGVFPITLVGGVASQTVTFPVVSTDYAISAHYSGDDNYSSADANITHDVIKATATIAVTSSPNPSQLGDAVTFTANVAVPSPGGGNPNGPVGDKITFFIDGVARDADSFCCGTATLAVNDLALGDHSVYATLTSDNYTANPSPTVAHSVAEIATTTTLTVSPSQATFGEDVNFNVKVEPTSVATAAPVTGAVSLEVDGNPVGTATLDAAGEASFALNTLVPGAHNATARFEGSSDFLESQSTNREITIDPDYVDILLTISPSPSSFYGEDVTVTATVTPQNGAAAPTGLVRFLSSGNPVDMQLSGGAASFITSALPVGTDDFLALYEGDPNYVGGASNLVGHEVVPDATTTTVVSSDASSIPGQEVTFTVSVAGAHSSETPSGEVTLSGLPGNPGPLTLVNGCASLTTNQLAAGTYTVLASFAAQDNFAASSGSMTQTVGKAVTTAKLTATPGAGAYGATIRLTTDLQTADGAPDPTGDVIYSVGGTPLGTAPAGSALDLGMLEPGSYNIVADYAGDAVYEPVTSNNVTVEIAKDTPAVTLQSSNPDAPFGQPVTFTIAVAPTASGAAPSGPIDLMIDGETQTLALTDGAASLTLSNLSVGQHEATALWNGDSRYGAAFSMRLVQTIGALTTSVSGSAADIVYGQNVVFSARVTSQFETQVPRGTVSFGYMGNWFDSPPLDANGEVIVGGGPMQAGTHTMQVRYNPEAGSPFEASGPTSFTFTVVKADPVLSFETDPATPGYGDLTSIIVRASANSIFKPTGSITLTVNGQMLGTAELVNGRADFDPVTVEIGTYALDASYGGDDNFNAGSASGSIEVGAGATATYLEGPSQPTHAGEAATFMATVVQANSNMTAEGNVVFTVDGAAQPAVALSGGVAAFTTTTLGVGDHTVEARFVANANFGTSSAELVTHAVNKGLTETVLASSGSSSTAGQAVTFTATVTSTTGGTPDGSVVFTIDGIAGTPIALDGSGVASFTTDALSVGDHIIEAGYSGSDNYEPSTGQTINHTVNANVFATVTTLGSSGSPSRAGEPVIFIATVTAPGFSQTPEGTVTFTIDGEPQPPASLSAGAATISVSTLAAGAHEVFAAYGGEADFTPSMSDVLMQQVDLRETTLVLTSSANPSTAGDDVTFTIAVTSPGAQPDGDVRLTIGGNQYVAPLSGGQVSFVISDLDPGAYTVTGEYLGTTVFAGNSEILSQVVSTHATTVTLASSQNPSGAGQPVSFTATVTSEGGTPPGDVVFTVDGDDVATVALSGGLATFTTSTLPTGSHTILAFYEGTDGMAAGQAKLQQSVELNATTTMVASSLNPSRVSNAVTFTAAVTSTGSKPDGSVTFTIDGAAMPSAALVDGAASVTVDTLAAGPHSINAAYSGSETFLASAGELSQQVETLPTGVKLVSSRNPAISGEEVVFTATVNGDGTPQGDVTFLVDGIGQATVSLAGGVASFATSTLTAGTHAISAAYGGSVAHAASQSETLSQAIGGTDDSKRLDEVQAQMTKMVAQTSGQAISGAIDSGVSDAFSEDGKLMEASEGMLGFSLVAPREPQQIIPASALDGLVGDSRLADRARASSDMMLGYAATPLAASLPETAERDPQNWRVWAKIHNTAWRTKPEKADIDGDQINVLAGVGYRLSPTLVIGAFGGYESFDYSSKPLDGRLEGDGWTVGGYLGWKITPALRFDAGFARSELSYDASAGTAAGMFGGERWLLQSGLTGSHAMNGFAIEPSARIYALWETQDAYTDTLGGFHDASSFSTARASGGVKMTYPFEVPGSYTLSPYLGFYADYYFSSEAGGLDLTYDDAVSDGWSARVTAGFAFDLDAGAQLSIGGELGGLGQGGAPHGSLKGDLRIPF